MNLGFSKGAPAVPARTPSVIPYGEFAGKEISGIATDDLRRLQMDFFRRAPAVQRAITRELARRGRRPGLKVLAAQRGVKNT
jgi:hypothetical protein